MSDGVGIKIMVGVLVYILIGGAISTAQSRYIAGACPGEQEEVWRMGVAVAIWPLLVGMGGIVAITYPPAIADAAPAKCPSKRRSATHA